MHNAIHIGIHITTSHVICFIGCNTRSNVGCDALACPYHDEANRFGGAGPDGTTGTVQASSDVVTSNLWRVMEISCYLLVLCYLKI